MRTTFLLFLPLLLSGICLGQKPPLRLDSFKEWSFVHGGGLSENGKFAFYTIYNYPLTKNTFVLQATSGSWKMEIIGLTSAKFTDDSRLLLGMLKGDSLATIDLKTKKIQKTANVRRFQLLTIDGQIRLLTINKLNRLTISDVSGKEKSFFYDNVKDYKFNRDGSRAVILQDDSAKKGAVVFRWVNTLEDKQQIIYRGLNIPTLNFDASGRSIAFIDQGETGNSIYYYKDGSPNASSIVNDDRSAKMKIELSGYCSFSKDGSKLFFEQKKSQDPATVSTIDLEMSSYQDDLLKSYRDGERSKLEANKTYLYSVDIMRDSVRRLTFENESIVSQTLALETDSIFLVESVTGLYQEVWNDAARPSYFLVNANTGERISIEINCAAPIYYWSVAPTGKFVVYFNPATQSYVSFNVQTGDKKVVLTANDAPLYQFQKLHYPAIENYPVGFAGWLPGGEAVVINGTFDLFKVDPTCIHKPVNLTGTKGQKQQIAFFPVSASKTVTIGKSGSILLSAFNLGTKDFGFYRLDLVNGNLLPLSMSGQYMGDIRNIYVQFSDVDFITNKKNDGYLLRWQKANSAPNYFFSKDLKSYRQLSNSQPQKQFNWLTSELHYYTDSSGNKCQGILYKPENFDPSKKYPVIMNIYELKSNQLNLYLKPDLVGADFNVPLLVSNGYVVFQPDIRGKVKYAGERALQIVNASADYLSKFPWVNRNKMAIVGHSFGGFETNYVITHTDRFAAAFSGSGISDMVRFATGLWGGGSSQEWMARYSYLMMESSLADDPETYIRNSPILYAKRLNTPTLFMHNDGDGNVNVEQTRSFFMVLRSLKKPCWWLNYKGQGHGVGGEKNQMDFNTKVWQFFDHYLKGQPMPDWMKEHI